MGTHIPVFPVGSDPTFALELKLALKFLGSIEVFEKIIFFCVTIIFMSLRRQME
jgi:hypothetical protein